MTMLKSVSRICAGLLVAGLFAIGGTSGASAQTATYEIQNQFGTTITLDTASCSPSASFFPPFSISNGGSSGQFSATGSGFSILCNARYQSGIYGCQFQINALSSGGGFASANAYKGGSGRPTCTVVSQTATSNGYSAVFRMQ